MAQDIACNERYLWLGLTWLGAERLNLGHECTEVSARGRYRLPGGEPAR